MEHYSEAAYRLGKNKKTLIPSAISPRAGKMDFAKRVNHFKECKLKLCEQII